MELSLLTRLRITAAMAAGALVIGFLAWPLAKPADPFSPVCLVTGQITINAAVQLAALAIISSVIAYFVSYPYGRHLGILAVPTGLAVWALRSGSMAELMRQNTTAAAKISLFNQIKWEPFFWLALIAIAFVTVRLCAKISPQKDKFNLTPQPTNNKSNPYINYAIAIAVSVLLAKFLVLIFAQDIKIADTRLGYVIVQLPNIQILFAVSVAFGIVAFAIKKFLSLDYTCPIIATALVQPVVIMFYLKADVIKRLAEHWPAVFYPNAITAILPIQMVAFGTLGAVAGYWLAVRYSYWRQNEC